MSLQNREIREQAKSLSEPDIKTLLDKLLAQEAEISRLTNLSKQLNDENEILLQLAKNEKQLKEQQNSLQKELRMSQQENIQLKERIQKQMIMIEDVKEFHENWQKMIPNSTTLQNLAKELEKINDEANVTRVFSFVNIVMVGTVVLLIAYSGFKLHTTGETMDLTYNSITNGLYTPDGYSAIQGTRSSEDIYKKDHHQ